MTTPGHQAGPTPAEGGLTPGAGFPPGDGVPEARDAGYDLPDAGDLRYGRPEAADPRHGRPEAADPRHGRPEATDPRYGPPGAGDIQYGRPEAADPRYGRPEAQARRSGRPEAEDSRYGPPGDGGRREAGLHSDLGARRAEARGRTRPRHAAGPGRAEWAAGPAAAPGAPAASDTVPDARTAGPGPADSDAEGSESSSLLRSSGVMAMGTIASRVTGFVRSAILIYAIGTKDLGNAYNLANTIPNIVYNLALGGILTSVVVPLLVNAAKRNRDRGEAYDQRIFTLGVLALGGITVVATLAAQPIASLYAGNIGSLAAYHLTVIFAYFFIPQIFFYGVSSLAGAILNARGSFAAPMWTPVINNVVVILVGLAFMATAGLNRTPENITAAQVQLLGIGTTLGIVLQTVALVPSLRRVGFRWHPRHDFRRAEVSEIGRMSGWMFGYVLTTQIAFLVTTRVANAAGARVSQHSPLAAGAGIAAYTNAYMLFQLPYAIVGISVITALLPRMSAHASERRYGLVTGDFSTAARLASVIVVPAGLILAVLGTPLAEGVFGYGSTSIASARYVGEIFAVFSLGLLPFTLFQLQLRVFYAMHDSRTPALISVFTMAINITANLLALAILPPQHVVAGLGAGFGLASLVGTVIAWRILSRRIGGLDGRRVGSALTRMYAATIPGVIFAVAVSVMVGAVVPEGRIAALLTVALGGSGAMLLYVLFAKAFGVTELTEVTDSVRARLR